MGPCSVPSRAQSPSEHRALPLPMAQPAFSWTPWSAQFLPPGLHPSLALLREVMPPGLFKMSLPLVVRQSSPRPSGSSGVPEPSTRCLLCYWPPLTLQGRGNMAASGDRLWPALVLTITNDLTGVGVPPEWQCEVCGLQVRAGLSLSTSTCLPCSWACLFPWGHNFLLGKMRVGILTWVGCPRREGVGPSRTTVFEPFCHTSGCPCSVSDPACPTPFSRPRSFCL